MRAYAAACVAMVWTISVVSCTSFPKPFTPHTPDEQAVARTVVTFLTAVKTQDLETLNTLVLPDATMAAFVDGSPEPPQPILASLQRADDSPLLHAAANKLVDFRQASPTQVSVGTYVNDIVNAPSYRGTDQVTTRIRWDLVQHDGQWRIQHMAQTIWITPYNAAGAGP
jgi:SnoaL-like domain